jgi:aminopeptidase N
VDTTSGERVFIDVAYNKDAQDFYKITDIARSSIEYMSFVFPAVPFPFPQITVFNGLSEMEYPMMVNNWTVYNEELEDYPNKENYSIALTAHEIFHSYFPFYMGINESKYAWMDEGWASFADYAITNKLISDSTATRWGTANYLLYDNVYKEIIGSELDLPMLSISKMTKRPTYSINSYAKPAMFYMVLENMLGKNEFKRTVQEYMRVWNGKHPMPYDFFFIFNKVSGQNLNWLFKPWFFDMGYPDLSIKNVVQQSGEYTIEIEKVGHYPVPVHLKLTYEDESTEILQRKVSVWKSGYSTCSVTCPDNKKIKRIELGNVTIPDANLMNNIYLCK